MDKKLPQFWFEDFCRCNQSLISQADQNGDYPKQRPCPNQLCSAEDSEIKRQASARPLWPAFSVLGSRPTVRSLKEPLVQAAPGVAKRSSALSLKEMNSATASEVEDSLSVSRLRALAVGGLSLHLSDPALDSLTVDSGDKKLVLCFATEFLGICLQVSNTLFLHHLKLSINESVFVLTHICASLFLVHRFAVTPLWRLPHPCADSHTREQEQWSSVLRLPGHSSLEMPQRTWSLRPKASSL